MKLVLKFCWGFYRLLVFLSIDINECELEGDDCHMYATCNDTFGSFECTCNSGFEGDGVNCTSMYASLKICCAKFNKHIDYYCGVVCVSCYLYGCYTNFVLFLLRY